MALQQRAVLTRARVLTAAADVFARSGFAAASLNDITAEADATKGALYFHFPGKDALAAAIVAEQSAQWPILLASIRSEAPNPLVAIVAITYEVGARCREDPIVRAGLRLSLERDLIDAEIEPAFEGWTSAIQDLLTDARRQGLVRAGVTPGPTARTLVGSFFGIQHTSNILTDRKDLESRLDEFWKLFLVAIAADPDWTATQRSYRKTLSAVHKATELTSD